MTMTGYLTYLMVEAQEAELAERAMRPRPARAPRTGRGHTGRFRSSTARLLMGLAVRLDDRLQRAPVPAATSVTGT
jgi:hypothetical protein